MGSRVSDLNCGRLIPAEAKYPYDFSPKFSIVLYNLFHVRRMKSFRLRNNAGDVVSDHDEAIMFCFSCKNIVLNILRAPVMPHLINVRFSESGINIE